MDKLVGRGWVGNGFRNIYEYYEYKKGYKKARHMCRVKIKRGNHFARKDIPIKDIVWFTSDDDGSQIDNLEIDIDYNKEVK